MKTAFHEQTEWDLDHLPPPDTSHQSHPSHSSPSPPDPLPPEVLTLIGFLSLRAQGPANPVTADQLAHWLGLHTSDGPRQVRSLISIYQDRFPFCLCAKAGAGYYVTDDPDLLARYDTYLFSVLRSVALRLRKARLNYGRCGYTRTGSAPNVAYHFRRSPRSNAQLEALQAASCQSGAVAGAGAPADPSLVNPTAAHKESPPCPSKS